MDLEKANLKLGQARYEMENADYDKVIDLINSGYKAINDNHSFIYGYLKNIRETQPKTAAGLELLILEQIPYDNSIGQEMARLHRIMSGED